MKMKITNTFIVLFLVFQIKSSYQEDIPEEESCPSGSDGVDCKEKASKPKTNERACCRAATAECLACAASLGVDDYCYMNPDTVGCDEIMKVLSSPPEDDMDDEGEEKEPESDYYFDSYAQISIHEEMLQDKIRTDAYKDAILKNKHLFKNKVVLDVGCGTGILSMFAAQAGAKHVFCVDYSAIIEHTEGIIAANGFDDKITAIRSKVEDLELPVERVDILISEWMGYCLFYESMLDSVLFARDKWLLGDGLMFPDIVTFHVAGIEDLDYQSKKVDWWKDVYGFDMSSIGSTWKDDAVVDTCKKNQVVTETQQLREIYLQIFTKEEIPFEEKFSLKMKRDDYVNAMVAYFDIEFSYGLTPVTFSTSPFSPYTHWKQTFFFFENYITAKKGEEINGTFKMKPNKKNIRDMDVEIDVSHKGEVGEFEEENKYIIR